MHAIGMTDRQLTCWASSVVKKIINADVVDMCDWNFSVRLMCLIMPPLTLKQSHIAWPHIWMNVGILRGCCFITIKLYSTLTPLL